eukprot:933777-Rhodomonas_salina.1
MEGLLRHKRLKKLELRGNPLLEAGIGKIAATLGEWEGLEWLGLSTTSMGPAGCMKLADAIRWGGGRMLTVLSLCNNGIGDEGAKSLAGVLPELWSLQ